MSYIRYVVLCDLHWVELSCIDINPRWLLWIVTLLHWAEWKKQTVRLISSCDVWQRKELLSEVTRLNVIMCPTMHWYSSTPQHTSQLYRFNAMASQSPCPKTPLLVPHDPHKLVLKHLGWPVNMLIKAVLTMCCTCFCRYSLLLVALVLHHFFPWTSISMQVLQNHYNQFNWKKLTHRSHATHATQHNSSKSRNSRNSCNWIVTTQINNATSYNL